MKARKSQSPCCYQDLVKAQSWDWQHVLSSFPGQLSLHLGLWHSFAWHRRNGAPLLLFSRLIRVQWKLFYTGFMESCSNCARKERFDFSGDHCLFYIENQNSKRHPELGCVDVFWAWMTEILWILALFIHQELNFGQPIKRANLIPIKAHGSAWTQSVIGFFSSRRDSTM